MAGHAMFRGGGESGALMREVDWGRTALGAADAWPQSLRTAVSIVLDSKFPMYIAWGPDFIQLYNDGYRPVLGATKHPAAMGARARDTFAESWHIIGPMFEGVRAGEAVGSEDWMLPLDRNGYLEECYFTFSYSPIRDESGGVGGVLVTVTETTGRVLAARRLRALQDLAAATANIRTAGEACAASAAVLARYQEDVPFALFYLVDEDAHEDRLSGASSADLASRTPAQAWPIAELLAWGGPGIDIDDVTARVGAIVAGEGRERVERAVALPIRRPGENARPYGVLVAGASPRRNLDDDYRSFFALVAAHVGTAITSAEALADERRRSERLADLDRAKTEFFSNVSHEFRTPLTLMLGPLDDALRDAEAPLAPAQRERHEVVRRNALRLQKLVDTLLEFSRVEAGRARPSFAPTDLSALTADLASSFRSAIERAGLALHVDCAPLPASLWVDPSMWEKIVLNLLSNAFKFTLEGSIRVALTARGDRVELTVRDTGTGIAEAEQARIFDRFHRVDGARGRSHEGSGIGLALVRELVSIHGGTLTVESAPGAGSTFVVSLPARVGGVARDDGGARAVVTGATRAPDTFLAEVAQWSDAAPDPAPRPKPERGLGEERGRILVVEDNADMRAYLARILSPHWEVDIAGDAAAVLSLAASRPFDLILSDVMMPGVDGLELVRTLRANELTRQLPIVLLSARAGEEAIVLGLESGANDYLVKPFTASELVARVRSQIALFRVTREAALATRAHVDETERLLADARRAVQSRDAILAVVSHDLRSPLSNVSLAADVLERVVKGGEGHARAHRQIGVLRRATERMTRLINDLLDVASIEAETLSIRPQHQRVDDLLREAQEAFDVAAAEKGIALTSRVAADVPQVSCDKERVLQVLGNLLSNALKFTPRGGSVSVEAEAARDGVVFAVRDTGSGIPAEAVPHVFDRFWHSAQASREGHGLGLAIAKGIVEAHGGAIRAESEHERGSVFSFSIPLESLGRKALSAQSLRARPSVAPPNDPGRSVQWLAGGGEMATLITDLDWSRSPLGAIEDWPQSLRTTVSLCLASNFPINIIWGEGHNQIYNDGYRVLCGAVHPRAMGESYRVTWASAWPAIGEPFERALEGETTFLENQRMFLERNGYPEETFFTFSLSPIRDSAGKIAGLFHPVAETTATILAERRTRLLRDIADGAGTSTLFDDACELLLASLERHQLDVPFAALYVTADDGAEARVRGVRGALSGSALAPEVIALAEGDGSGQRAWPLAEASAVHKALRVDDVVARFGSNTAGQYPEPLATAFVIPVRVAGLAGPPLAFLVIGASQRLPLDAAYEGLVEMLAAASTAALANARAFELERKRAEALAELNRAKTAFFSNVSHEFRTPLTLMLGPLGDILSGARGGVAAPVRAELEVVQRSAVRLLKLVNSLLDFSRIEAGRAEAALVPTDLAALTGDVASAFRSTIETAGLRFTVSVDARLPLVPADRDMWEKIVLNLVSNAFKFTHEGGIDVSLQRADAFAELVVRDTGIGIAGEDVGRVFDRFHRVQGATGRTHEGSGIGLALVKDLAHLHGGSVAVTSTVGEGSAFTVRIPLVSHRTGLSPTPRPAEVDRARAHAFVDEAATWEANRREASGVSGPSSLTRDAKAHVVLADDNADMRDYVRRLLEGHGYAVTAVSNGLEALRAAEATQPDLVLSDVMMPVMDGSTLVARLRATSALRAVPIVLLSARAGDDEAAGALDLGADDYLTKPFSTKELLARVGSQLAMAALRRRAAEQDARAAQREVVEADLRKAIELRDQFITIAAHELRTPLTSLQLQVSALVKKFERAPSAEIKPSRLARIDRQVERMAELVESLLEVNELSAGRVKLTLGEVSLSDVVTRVSAASGAGLEAAGCALTTSIEHGVTARGDRLRIEQIVLGFLANAIRYAAGAPIDLCVARRGLRAVVSVRDRGNGIDGSDQGRIFERFGRASSAEHYGGFGLGLWTAKVVAEAMGATVTVESELGQGSTFTLELPCPRAHLDEASRPRG